MTVIYHGTPMTPRAALLEVCKGRAMCVSFFRPDDVEAVEAISPAIMFRQRRVFNVEGGAAQGAGLGRALGLGRLLRVVGAASVSSWPVGSHSRYAGRPKPAQRCPTGSMAVRAEGFPALAYGRTNRAAAAAMRQVRPGFAWLDGRGKAFGSARIPSTHGRSGQGSGQPLAGHSHDARFEGRMGLSVCQCGRNNTRTERMAL